MLFLVSIALVGLLAMAYTNHAAADVNTCGGADVGGIVYLERPLNGTSLNKYGVRDSNEPGLGDVLVEVLDGSGQVRSTTTAPDGSWTITPMAYPVRITFSLPDGLYDSQLGNDSHTSVQFRDRGDCNVNLGVQESDDYTDEANPFITVPKQFNALIGSRTDGALISFRYDQSGYYGQSADGSDKEYTDYKDAELQQVGSLYGLAYQPEKQRLFGSTLLRRYVELRAGTDAIFVMDYSKGRPPAITHFNLNGTSTAHGGTIDLGSVCRSTSCDPLGTGNADDYPLASGPLDPSRDMDAFDKVGKVSFGDIDLEENHRILWAVNLNQRALIRIDVSGDALPGDVDQYIISSLPGAPACSGGVLRPWALKFHRGRGYLGAVCDAQSSNRRSDLRAYILAFDPENILDGFTTELDFALDYVRDNNDGTMNANFHPWIDVQGYYDNVWNGDPAQGDSSQQVYAQPFLADIEFIEPGSMFIGIGDRFGYQMGRSNYPPISGNTSWKSAKSYGDVLKACRVNGAWILEEAGNAACPTNYDAIQGVNNNGGEFFFDSGGDGRTETASGALALLPGAGHLLATIKEPYPGGSTSSTYWNNSGVHWFRLSDGGIDSWIQLDPTYLSGSTDNESNRSNNFGKANDIGDIELLTAPAPLEIGDRIWCDSDGDGLQDPGESGVDNIAVTLQCDIDGDGFGDGDDVAATVNTDSQGGYHFRDGDASLSAFPVAPWNASIHIIPRHTTCRVLIDPDDTALDASCGMGDYVASPRDQGGDDRVDSDGVDDVDAAGHIGATFITPDSGQNNHDYDLGVKEPVRSSLGDYVWWDVDDDGVQDAGEPGIADVTVTLKNASGSTVATTTTDSNGGYSFNDLFPGDYRVVFTLPSSDWSFSPQNQGGDDARDSDADPNTGETDLITLSPGEDDDSVDAGMDIPASYVLTKENTTVETELAPDDPISFTITIKNTGDTILTVVPLRDTYDTNYLAFTGASVAPDDTTDDGQIDWSDLTASFGQDLGPGESFSLIVNFTAKAPTDDLANHETINTGTVHGLMADPDGATGPISAVSLPDQSDDAPVGILDPVGEAMRGFSAVAVGHVVRLQWQTASEADILGFNVLRGSEGGPFQPVNDEVIFARHAGADVGGLYRFRDLLASGEDAVYTLEIIHLNGRMERYGRVMISPVDKP